MDNLNVSAKEEIGKIFMRKPHVLILGAGVNNAALHNGDENGQPVPLMKDLAKQLSLQSLFPTELQALSEVNFEDAYSKLFKNGNTKEVEIINEKISEYFNNLKLPREANLYDVITLSLREKDVIATFNWDPFLMQSRIRLASHGVTKFPKLFFLHGNVQVGYCSKDKKRGVIGRKCKKCGNYFLPSQLLYPIENKNYNDGDFIQREWDAIRCFLKRCFMVSIFGYSAPKTDIEAIKLLKEGWGDIVERNMEQTEIICRPGSDQNKLRKTWSDFIHTHHYEIHESFYDSFLGKHPRRSGEAYWNQYYKAKFIADNSIPSNIKELDKLVKWFQPLLNIEN
jgi:hypothetical protein